MEEKKIDNIQSRGEVNGLKVEGLGWSRWRAVVMKFGALLEEIFWNLRLKSVDFNAFGPIEDNFLCFCSITSGVWTPNPHGFATDYET